MRKVNNIWGSWKVDFKARYYRAVDGNVHYDEFQHCYLLIVGEASPAIGEITFLPGSTQK